MDSNQKQALEQNLRSQWGKVYPQILDRFTTVSRADLDSATSADDLVRRIADKSHYSERYVESRLGELVGVGASGGTGEQFGGIREQSFGGGTSQQ